MSIPTKEEYEKLANAWVRDIDVQKAIQDAVVAERWRIMGILDELQIFEERTQVERLVFGEET